MIYDLTVRNPKRTPVVHWSTVKFLRKVASLQFKPGLNVIAGENGSGKSTVLTSLAVLLHCFHENWPRVSMDSLAPFMRPMGFADGLLLEHDGMPARYLGTRAELAFAPTDAKSVSLILKPGQGSFKALDQQSTGQAMLTRLTRFLNAEPKKVKYSMRASRHVGADTKDLIDVGTESLKNVSRRPGLARQSVILLDEPDRSLDLAMQATVWKQIRTLAAGGEHQIIVASHSPFAMALPAAHYVETSAGFVERMKNGMKALSAVTT